MSMYDSPIAVLRSRLLSGFFTTGILSVASSALVLHIFNSGVVCVLLSCFEFLLRMMRICEPSHNLFLSPLGA